jgi:hypothetical protein
MFLHIMLGQNPKKSNAKKITLLTLVHVFVPKQCTSQCIKIFIEYIEKMIEMILNIYETFSIY